MLSPRPQLPERSVRFSRRPEILFTLQTLPCNAHSSLMVKLGDLLDSAVEAVQRHGDIPVAVVLVDANGSVTTKTSLECCLMRLNKDGEEKVFFALRIVEENDKEMCLN